MLLQFRTRTQAGCCRSLPHHLLCRTIVLIAAALAVLTSQSVDAQQRVANSADRPNIIFIMADDLGYGELGCYGQQKILTPRIDELAAEGMRFTDAYAGSRVCQPSRSVLMTGLHTGHTPVRANDVDQLLYDRDTTVAEVLKNAGYATGAFGKWGLGFEGTQGHPNRQGFDEFFGQLLQVHAHFYYPYWVWHNNQRFPLPENEHHRRGRYVHDEIHAHAMSFIRDHKDQPFFAYLPYIIPHVELVVPEESERPYRGKFPKKPIPDPRPGYIGSDNGYVTFAAMISRLDQHVGQIIDLLRELKIDDRTIVFFTSDNGGQGGGKDNGWTDMTDFFHGNGPLRGYKGQFYEGGIRVPLIAWWPGHIKAGSTSHQICGFWDVLPTLADLAGAAVPPNLDGVSLVPTLLHQGKQEQPALIYWEYPIRSGGISRAARSGRWKLVQNRSGGPIELYDLKSDVGERTNLASQHADIVRRMVALMDSAHTPPRKFPKRIERPTIDDYVR